MAVHTAIGVLIAGIGLLYWLIRQMARGEPIVTRAIPFFIVAGTSVMVLGAVVLVSNEQRIEGTRYGVGASLDGLLIAAAVRVG